MLLPVDPAVVAEAAEVSDAAAAHAGLTLRELATVDEINAAGELFRQVWGAHTADEVINRSAMRALACAGNYLVAAYRDGVMVGAAVAFLGLVPEGIEVHSHVAGVRPGVQGGGVGWVMKQHQRAWALARGIRRVCWTYDPLIHRNAHFNMQKLGGLPTEYLPDFYGVLDDGINTGDVTDRLLLLWQLDSPRAVAAARRELAAPDAAALRAAGAVVLVGAAGEDPVTPDEGTAVAARAAADAGAVALVAVPADIEAMRPARPAAAKAWRFAVRDGLGDALAAGYRFAGFDNTGWYVLEPGEVGQ